jgi:hypothetical protein
VRPYTPHARAPCAAHIAYDTRHTHSHACARTLTRTLVHTARAAVTAYVITAAGVRAVTARALEPARSGGVEDKRVCACVVHRHYTRWPLARKQPVAAAHSRAPTPPLRNMEAQPDVRYTVFRMLRFCAV